MVSTGPQATGKSTIAKCKGALKYKSGQLEEGI